MRGAQVGHCLRHRWLGRAVPEAQCAQAGRRLALPSEHTVPQTLLCPAIPCLTHPYSIRVHCALATVLPEHYYSAWAHYASSNVVAEHTAPQALLYLSTLCPRSG